MSSTSLTAILGIHVLTCHVMQPLFFSVSYKRWPQFTITSKTRCLYEKRESTLQKSSQGIKFCGFAMVTTPTNYLHRAPGTKFVQGEQGYDRKRNLTWVLCVRCFFLRKDRHWTGILDSRSRTIKAERYVSQVLVLVSEGSSFCMIDMVHVSDFIRDHASSSENIRTGLILGYITNRQHIRFNYCHLSS